MLSAAQGVALKAMIDGIVIPTALPNPQPITINGQRYDGSEAVTVTVSSEGGGTPVEIDDTLTQSGKAADAKVVGDQISALNEANATQDEEIAKRAKDADLAAVAKSGSYNDLTDKPNSDINIVYPIQRSPYYDLLAKKIQNKALNANLVSTDGYMAHSSMGVSDVDFMCIAWGENNTEGDTSTDTSTSSGKWHVRCKIFGGYYGFKYHLLNGGNPQSTEAFDVFPAGTEVLDASGSSLGTIVSSSDSTVTKDFVNDNNKGHFVISSLCYMSTGKKIAVSRRLVATYANKAVSYTLADEIFPFTLTVDGVNGENDLKRVNTEWPSHIGYGSCGYSYNSIDEKFYLAATISNTGVALLSTTDFVEHTYVAFYPYDKASLECALFFDTAWISNTYKSGVYLACRSVYGHEYIRLAKLDYSNGYSVMDEIDLPATTSRPFFTQSYNKSTDVPCYLMVSDYTRARASIYQVVQKNIRQLRPIAVIDAMCCNYPAIFNVSETNIFGAKDLDYIICGTNGVASDIKGVSWFHENFKFGTYSLDDFKYVLPIASSTTLGGVMPSAKTDEMTQAVGVDETGGLWTMAGGTSVGDGFELICDIDLASKFGEMTPSINKTIYSLTKAYRRIRGYLKATGTTDPNNNWSFELHNIGLSFFKSCSVTKTGNSWITFDAEVYDGYAVSKYSRTSASNSPQTLSCSMKLDLTSDAFLGNIKLFAANVNGAFAEGSVFKAWGIPTE